MAAASHSASHANPSTYLWIWGWLAGLMLLGVFMAEGLRAPKPVVVLTIMGLSTVKAVLVAGYYMHLKFDRRWLTGLVLFPFLLIGLAVLLVLSSTWIQL